MCKIIAIANVKGGVGKTTTTGNLAAALVARGRRVLVVDLDPQASMTLAAGVHAGQLAGTVRDSLSTKSAPAVSLCVPVAGGYHLLPADHNLRSVEPELENGRVRIFALRGVLEPLRFEYDYVLIDCPASAGILTGNALAAADQVIIPFPADYLSLQALDWFLDIVRETQQKVAPGLHVAGLLLTMYDPHLRHSREIVEEARRRYGVELPIFSAVVPPSVAFKQASRRAQSILEHAADSEAAAAYRLLAQEVEAGILESPADAFAEVRQGRARLAEQNRAAAFAHFSNATRLQPGLVEAWLGKAASAPQWDEGIRSLVHAFALDHTRTEVRCELEAVLRAHLQYATRYDLPQLMSIGAELAQADLPEHADLVFQRVVELDPSNEEAWLGRARVSAEPDVAIGHVRQALGQKPESKRAQAELAAVTSRARQRAQQLVEEAETALRQGMIERAHVTFQQAAALDGQNVRAWLGAAHSTEDLDRALAFTNRALEIDPSDAEALRLHRYLWKPEVEPGDMVARSRVWSFLIALVVILLSLIVLAYLTIH